MLNCYCREHLIFFNAFCGTDITVIGAQYATLTLSSCPGASIEQWEILFMTQYFNFILVDNEVRDRPFNLKGWWGLWFFCFVQNFFFGQHESQNIYFCCCAKCEIFFQNSTLGYITKTLNHIIFFSSTKIRIFFQQHWESEYFFF